MSVATKRLRGLRPKQKVGPGSGSSEKAAPKPAKPAKKKSSKY